MLWLATKKAAAMIETELGRITPTVINPRFTSGLDTDTLSGLITTHQLLLTHGRWPSCEGRAMDKLVASYLGKAPRSKLSILVLDKIFHDRYQANELLYKK